jgi:hypothetical protein
MMLLLPARAVRVFVKANMVLAALARPVPGFVKLLSGCASRSSETLRSIVAKMRARSCRTASSDHLEINGKSIA